MNNKTKTRSLRVAIIAIALLLCFALAVGVTSALYQARRQATGTLNMDKGIVIDYKGFNKGDENIWQRETTTSFKLFEETNAQPGQEISVYPSGIRANVDSINFYARLKLEYIFYNVANGVETKVDLPNPKSLIKTSNDFFASNWVPSTDGYYYFGENTTLNQFSKDNQNFENLFADGAKFIIEGANFEGETAGEGGGFVVNGTAINKIVVYLTLETLQGDATAEQAKDLGWVITTLNEQIVDITNIPDEKPEINIDDIISDDKKDGEITITGDPTQKLIITIGSKAFYGCSKLKLTLSNSENIVYQIATDAFSTGATIMYGIDNVSSKLINPSTTGHTTVGFDGKWQVSAPGLYLFLPSPITPTTTSYGDFQYTDDQGTWYFDLIDESGNKVDASTLSSTISRNGASTFGASTYDNTDNYTAKLNKFEPKDGVTTVVIPKYLGVSEDSNKFAVTKIDCYAHSSGFWIGAFYKCSALISIKIPDSVIKIGYGSFQECYALTSITIPDSVTSIGNMAFNNCNNLTSITIPDSVISIGQYAFESCSNLTSITIPDSVISIGSEVFSSCSNLTSIIVDSGNINYHSSGNCLIETASKTLIAGCKNSIIPTDGSVTNIGNGAFFACSELTEITIPNSVTSIGKNAFSHCYALTSIVISNSLTSIGKNAFIYCSKLTLITIPNNVTSIGEGAFYGCSGLTSITIPNSVTSIGGNVFGECSGLTSIHIGAGIQEVSWLPDNVAEMTITISANNPYLATDGKAIFTKLNGKLSVSKYISADTTYDIPSAVDGSPVTSIGKNAFSGCSGLTSITIPDGVTSIGWEAFRFCSDLTSVTIGNGVTSIGYYAFGSCSGLTSITIPDGVTSIGDYAFDRCSGLTTITIPDSVTRIGNGVFSDCSGLISVTVGNGVTYTGGGVFSRCISLTSIVLPEGIKEISYGWFSGCTSLESVTIPSTCTTIRDSAFENCSNLTTVIWNISYDLGGVNATGPELSSFETSTTGGLTITDTLKSAPTNVESGFTFEGWSDGTNIYQPGEKITFSLKNRKLTAIWSNCRVTFDANGGTGSVDSQIVSKGSSITLPSLDSFTKEGYVAVAWALDKNSTGYYYSEGSSYTLNENKTFYAVWDKLSNDVTTGYTNVKFDLNGGEGKLTFEGAVKNNTNLVLPEITGVTKSGYIFKGWGTSQTSEANYTPGDSIHWNANMTFYAVWGQPIKFVFKANGGVGDDVTITETDTLKSFTISDYVNYTRLNYRLLGFSIYKNDNKPEINGLIKFSDYSEDQVFYAIWEKYIEISFDRNGGEGDPIDSVFEQRGTDLVTITFPDLTGTREGYKFLGWSTYKNDTSGSYKGGQTATIDLYFDDIVFYAVWKLYIKVTINYNDGVNADEILQETDSVTKFDLSSYSAKVVSPEGKYFEYWNVVDFEQMFWPEDTIYCSFYSENIVITPFFKECETFIFNPNYEEGENVIWTRTASDTILDFSKFEITREGYLLLGWTDDPTSTGLPWAYNATQDLSWWSDEGQEITLYAVWEQLSNEFTTGYTNVKFDLNGGTGKLTFEGVYSSGDLFTLPGIDGVTKEGYAFLGWEKGSSEAVTPSYRAGESVSYDGVTIYAIWEKLSNEFTTGYTNVKFDLNGGTGKLTIEGTYRRGDTFKLPSIDGVTKEGYTFLGWSTSSNSTTPSYYPGDNTDFYNETYYAVWSKIITISFDLNGGEGTLPDPVQTAYNTKIVFNTGTNFTKEGYKFAGWQLVDGNGNNCGTYNAETNQTFYNNGENYTLKAMWSEPQTITFYNDNTKSQSFTMTGFFDTDGITFPEGNELTKEGYILVGWNTSANSSYVRYSIGQKYSNFSGYTELYAVWKSESEVAKIIFNFSEVEGQENIIKIGYDSSFVISDVVGSIIENIRNSSGQAIAGWSWTQGSSNVDEYNDNWIYFSNYQGQTKTLYPVWKNVLTINFDLNGGEGTLPESFEVWDRKSFDIPEVSLTKDGYIFAGWAWRSNSTYTDYRNGETNRTFYESDTYGSTTLYAVWKQPLTISFDANGGEGQVPEDIITYADGRINIPKVALTRDGYVFLGWSFNKNPIWDGIEYSNGVEDRGYYQFSSKTLYAVWGNTVTYIFDLNGGTGTVPGSISADYNTMISVPSGNGFERAGYKFKGWSINPNSNNYNWSSGSSYAYGISGTITMYAVWEVLTDQVYVGSLTQAELDAVQALWNGHTSRSELTDASLLNSMSDSKLHSRFNILGYLNNTSLKSNTTGNSSYGISWSTRYYKLSTNTYTFEFENSLPTGWMLVNWRYEVKASGDVTIVNGRAKATIDYTYAGFENSLSEERLMIIFVLPNQPAEDKSVSVSISGLPGNALEAVLKGTGNEALNNLMLSGITVEIYNADGSLIWTGKPNDSNQGFVKYRFATGTYKIRFYTTNVNGVAFVDNDKGTEVTGMDISAITKGDGYSEFTINYTFAEGNPNLAIIFKMADVDVDKIMEVSAEKELSGPRNIVGNWFKGMFANMGVAFTDMTADEIKYAGYCGMLIQEYFNRSICNLPSFSIYTSDGKFVENCEYMALIAGVEYTIKFTEEVKELLIAGNDTMTIKSITDITYNAETGTWDTTFNVFDTEGSILMFLTADLDLSQYEDLPAYDAATDYSQYLEIH